MYIQIVLNIYVLYFFYRCIYVYTKLVYNRKVYKLYLKDFSNSFLFFCYCTLYMHVYASSNFDSNCKDAFMLSQWRIHHKIVEIRIF